MKSCIECGEPADAPAEAQSDDHPICSRCLSQGWLEGMDAAAAIVSDTELAGKIAIASPISFDS